ncbi:hypothetical protein AR457_15260 [Streptomyces agglomeratus]|uniref:DUF4241 domain-containing protein n=2 Tax=Streptomyces agglomeratus TaxID=285458 RepID=A0A1E5P7V1_9ACTN|nr:hypothetical protein AS594_15075 [Streptomyces agglomeratus]OEJ40338.1 hypothetical protein BGK70_21395 [Streptomyces agglomeratus]OEJ45284.1 hypothetical protein AR457_15260 [Streptomyces agglomeratus]OEJ52888.1 hypothetical protein BGK72_21035 [Streptomyces agglomeratus]
MGGSGAVVAVSCAEGWDFAACEVRGPMSRERAAARDGAGLPYVVVFRVAGRAAPVEVWLVSWQDHYLGVWGYDEPGRRTDEFDLRLLDGDRLLRRYTKSRQYDGPDAAEFDEDRCRVDALELFADGGAVRTTRAGRSGGSLSTRPSIGDEQRWRARPAFGEWEPFTAGKQGFDGLPLVFEGDAAPLTEGRAGKKAEPWLPPRPARPLHLDALFRPGTRLWTSFEPMTVLDVRPVGTVRVPSGRLVVDCPWTGDGRELTVGVPAGEYVVESAWTHCAYEFMGAHVEHEDTPAVRLRVSDEPVAEWEMGLAPEDDLRVLPDGHAYGFSTDVAAGSFADGAAWQPLSEPFRQAAGQRAVEAEELGNGFLRTTEEALSADLLSFCTDGDGTYAVWVGRSESGDVAAVVVQTGHLPDLKVLD